MMMMIMMIFAINKTVSSTPNAKCNLLVKFKDTVYDAPITIQFSASQKNILMITIWG
jgi:hypothetical protein